MQIYIENIKDGFWGSLLIKWNKGIKSLLKIMVIYVRNERIMRANKLMNVSMNVSKVSKVYSALKSFIILN